MKGAAILIPLGSSLLFIQSVAPAVAKPWTPIAELGPFTIYQEGIYTGLVLLGRIATGLIAALVLVMTTHPSDLFTSLGKLKVPYILNFMMAMTLQLIPLFQREVGIIMSAQKSRGMKGSGFSAVLPSFIPVFVGAIERVQQLSISLESRGFGSLGHRTSYRSIRPRPLDWVVGAIGLIGAAVLIVASVSRGMWSLMAVIAFPAPLALTIVIVAGAAFIATLGLALFIGLRK
jgi:energy-coupling factor transport system permease protein